MGAAESVSKQLTLDACLPGRAKRLARARVVKVTIIARVVER